MAAGGASVRLPSDTEILITRTIEAPVRRVFGAWTTPALIRAWWGDHSTLTVCEIDLRPGGAWRYVARGPDGSERGWSGTFLEVSAPRSLVSTEIEDGRADVETVSSVTFSADGDTTVVSIHISYPNRDERDARLDAPMEPHMQSALDRLEAIVRRPADG